MARRLIPSRILPVVTGVYFKPCRRRTGVFSKLSLEGDRKKDFVSTLPTMLPEALQGQKQAEYSKNQGPTPTAPRLTESQIRFRGGYSHLASGTFLVTPCSPGDEETEVLYFPWHFHNHGVERNGRCKQNYLFLVQLVGHCTLKYKILLHLRRGAENDTSAPPGLVFCDQE